MKSPIVLILAAGEGKRMKSSLPKVLHPLCGRPLLSYVLNTARQLRPKKIAVVVGHEAGTVKKAFKDQKISWVLQKRRQGTANAALAASNVMRHETAPLAILYGDIPLLKATTLRRMQEVFDQEKAALVFLTAFLEKPTGYGRVVRNTAGEVVRIVEEKDASAEEKNICEINTGIYFADSKETFTMLRRIKRSSTTGEYYLTGLIELFLKNGKKVISVSAESPQESLGINSRLEMAQAEMWQQRKMNEEWMGSGVTLRNPDSISIDADVILEKDVRIHQGVVITGRSRIRAGAEILPYSLIEESEVGSLARVGPFAHLRPGSVVGEKAHVGNFVELKKAHLSRGAKANHLSYLGDTSIGEGTNIGAGTITCNYDGFKKYKTIIGKNVFVGSDVQFVAPVRIDNGAWIGAGTTVTKNIPGGALALSRVEQKNIKGWVKRRKKH